ncbi:hypothetical protein CBR_g17028 [Chara braunii]|uniref:Uncharacterized protein n=1 Tax=Chara braunii TaxID=69332 RepID=A0A388KUF4_CHABU|nr:hypothetical protein CBR_g17028 [Chara braunii]|eukprot:GBG73686.1 hypothetical protein CBR_g17028 [Chara braunii]
MVEIVKDNLEVDVKQMSAYIESQTTEINSLRQQRDTELQEHKDETEKLQAEVKSLERQLLTATWKIESQEALLQQQQEEIERNEKQYGNLPWHGSNETVKVIDAGTQTDVVPPDEGRLVSFAKQTGTSADVSLSLHHGRNDLDDHEANDGSPHPQAPVIELLKNEKVITGGTAVASPAKPNVAPDGPEELPKVTASPVGNAIEDLGQAVISRAGTHDPSMIGIIRDNLRVVDPVEDPGHNTSSIEQEEEVQTAKAPVNSTELPSWDTAPTPERAPPHELQSASNASGMLSPRKAPKEQPSTIAASPRALPQGAHETTSSGAERVLVDGMRGKTDMVRKDNDAWLTLSAENKKIMELKETRRRLELESSRNRDREEKLEERNANFFAKYKKLYTISKQVLVKASWPSSHTTHWS